MPLFVPKWRNRSRDPWVRKTYQAWGSMVNRCHNPKDKQYRDYGERGIAVCERWRDNFDAFVLDMDFAPKGMSLDRIDNDGNYDPFNCRWATRKEQANNTRKNVLVTLNGKTMTATLWAESLGISVTRFHARLKRGWKPEQAADPRDRSRVSPHGAHQRYMTGCRCDICVEGMRKRKRLYYHRPKRKYDL